MGGTRHPNGSGAPQPDLGWNLGPVGGPNWGGTGGGISGTGLTGSSFTGFTKPLWQSSLSGTARQLPDLAMDADPGTGLMTTGSDANVCGTPYSGPCQLQVGGTSLAAPLTAAMLSQLVASHVGSGSALGLGDIHPLLYAHPEVFNDVTTNYDSGNPVAYPAGVGFDQATGLGTPIMSALGAVLFPNAPALSSPATSASHSVPVWISPPSAVTPASWFVSGTDTGCVGGGTGTAIPPTQVSIADGTHTIYARLRTSDNRCSEVSTSSIVVDTTPPDVSITSFAPAAGQLVLNWTASDSTSGVGTQTVHLRRFSDGTDAAPPQILSATARSASFSAPTDTPVYAVLSVSDAFGNAAPDQSSAATPTALIQSWRRPDSRSTTARLDWVAHGSAGGPVAVTLNVLDAHGAPITSRPLTGTSGVALVPLNRGILAQAVLSVRDMSGNIGTATSTTFVGSPLDDRAVRSSTQWRSMRSAKAANGTVKQTARAGARMTARLTCLHPGVMLLAGPTGGLVRITVDGRSRVIDTWSARTRQLSVFVGNASSTPADRTITVTVLGRHGKHSGSGVAVSVDAFLI